MNRWICMALCCFFAIPSLAQWKTKDAALFQQELDEWYAGPESALTEKEKETFSTLGYFPLNNDYKVEAIFTRIEDAPVFQMGTSSPRNAPYRKYGYLAFTLKGKTQKLFIYEGIEKSPESEYANYFTLPYGDKTNGKQTYHGGRYIGFWKEDLQDGQSVTLDFNLSYNPSCAYNKGYSCIIPPPENYLPIKIKAGVKKWH